MPNRVALFLGALLAAIAVGLGAYAAHGLEATLVGLKYEPDLAKRMDWFETGVRYHLYHAIGIICTVLVAEIAGTARLLRVAPILFLFGIVLFSGSLYVMALGPESWRWLGAIVPLGGIAMIAGWITVACTAWMIKPTIKPNM